MLDVDMSLSLTKKINCSKQELVKNYDSSIIVHLTWVDIWFTESQSGHVHFKREDLFILTVLGTIESNKVFHNSNNSSIQEI